MKRALLDVSVLLALLDIDHVDHQTARTWLAAEGSSGWASCAITQNGFVRIISQPHYPSPVSLAQAIERLAQAVSNEHHEYWTCSASLVDRGVIAPQNLRGSGQVTDAYLLALAVKHDGRFVTLDQSVALDTVPNAVPASLVIL